MINVAPYKVKGTDKLRSGFRVKYNLAIDKIIKDATLDEEGLLTFITQDGTELEVNLADSFYTKEQINDLYFITYATEEVEGIIRIATMEEVLDGEDDSTVVTPYKLSQILGYFNGRTAIAGEDLTAGDMIYLYLPDTVEEPEDPENPEESMYPVMIAKKAVANDLLVVAMGFVEYDTEEGDEVPIKLSGNVNTTYENLTPGTYYYLSTEDPGLITNIPPVLPGEYQQIVGYGISANEVMIEIHRPELNWLPVFVNFPELYFTVGVESIESILLNDFFAPYNFKIDDDGNVVANFTYRFKDLPSFISEHAVVFNELVLTGNGEKVGVYYAYLEVMDTIGRKDDVLLVLNVVDATITETTLLDVSDDPNGVEIGILPGSFLVVDKIDINSVVTGRHDKIKWTLTGGGPAGQAVNITKELEVTEVESGSYQVFLEDGGVLSPVGQYTFTTKSYRGINLMSEEVANFVLYDEEYLNQLKLFVTKLLEVVGEIAQDGTSVFVHQKLCNIKAEVAEIEFDRIVIDLVFEGTIIKTLDEDVIDTEYYLYSEDTELDPGVYEIMITFFLLDVIQQKRNVEFIVLEPDIEAKAGLQLVVFKPGTTNYIITEELPLKGAEFDLPINYSVLFSGLGGNPYFSVEKQFFKLRGAAMAEIDISQITGNPQIITYNKAVTDEKVLIFGLKNSTQIDDVHEAPSQVRAIFTARDEKGEIAGIIQSDFSFRVPLLPGDYSGLRFLNFGPLAVLDENMPLSGRKYIFPFPRYWSVSARSFNGDSFDHVIVNLEKWISGIWVNLHVLGSTYIVRYDAGGIVQELAQDDMAYVFGNPITAGGLRFAVNPLGETVLIDEVGMYRASFTPELAGVLGTPKVTEFELIEEPELLPIKDCCGGDGGEGSGWGLTEW